MSATLMEGRRSAKQIYPPAWLQARELVMESEDATAEEIRRLVDLLERGGVALARLQELVDSPSLIPVRMNDPWLLLLEFIDDDLTDLFRSAAAGAASLISSANPTEDADPSEVKADITVLGRYLTLALLAAQHPTVPAEVRHTFKGVAHEMRGWDLETARVIELIEQRYHGFDPSGLGEAEDV